MNLGEQNMNGQMAGSNTNLNQASNMDMHSKKMEEQQERVQNVQTGSITRDFKFEAQKVRIEQILQRPRSQEYLDAVEMIDFLSSHDEEIIERLKESMGEEYVEELTEMTDDEIFEMITGAFHEEFAALETNLDDTLIAVLSRCYIKGCDCHAIDREGHILAHYQSDMVLPEEYERGRILFRNKGAECSCVEIYKNCCRVISSDGDVEVVI